MYLGLYVYPDQQGQTTTCGRQQDVRFPVHADIFSLWKVKEEPV